MMRDEIIRQLRDHLEELKGMGVNRIALFGSFARGEEQAESDIDLLVEFSSPPGFDGYMRVKFYLEDLLSAKVDLVMIGALKPWAREKVQREAIYVT